MILIELFLIKKVIDINKELNKIIVPEIPPLKPLVKYMSSIRRRTSIVTLFLL